MATPNQAALDEFKNIKAAKIRWVTFEITKDFVITVDKTGERKTGWEDFKSALPDTRPRYCIYDFCHTTQENRKTAKLYFIFWVPKNVNPKDRVLYSEAMSAFRDRCEGVVPKACGKMSEIKELLSSEDKPAGAAAAAASS